MIEQLRERRRAGLSFRKLGREFDISYETARKYAGDIKVERPKEELHKCEVCGMEFWAYKVVNKKTCSNSCAGISRGTPVAVLNNDGKVMKAFNSITEASKEMGLSREVIGFASDEENMIYKTAGGYVFKRI